MSEREEAGLAITEEVTQGLSRQVEEQNQLLQQAAAWVKSGLLPSSIKTPEQAAVVALKGKELGLNPMMSFEFIDVIMGKPALKPKAMASLIRKAGVKYKTIKDFEPVLDEEGKRIDMETVIRFFRDGDEEDVKYTYKDAQALGLTSKDNWKKQPGIMLWWRTFSKGANRVCPDIIGGLYTNEELASFTKNAPLIEITEDGDSVVVG